MTFPFPALLRPLVASLAVFVSVAGPATAQQWQVRRHDDGSFFLASVNLPGAGPAFTIMCGGRSPQGVSPMVTGNVEPETTAPGILRISFDPSDLGLPVSGLEPTIEVILAVGGQGYRLPPVVWDEFFGQWQADLLAKDAMFAAIAAAPIVDVHGNGRAYRVSAAGFDAAYADLVRICADTFAAAGAPWPGAVAAAVPGAGSWIRQAAQAKLASGCSGPHRAVPDAFLTGEIDGDGAEDVVLNWGRVQCLTGDPRPFCGASACSVDVFLTALFPARGAPEAMLGQGVRLQPLTNGNMAVAVGGTLGECSAAFATTGCEFLYYWNGYDLVPLR